MGLIGHNRGPALAPGTGWHRHCWTEARAALLPTLPIEVIRTRVRRAAELGLEYRTYAGVRATTGHDLVAFLFSSNALRITPLAPALPPDRDAKLAALIAAGRVVLTAGRLDPGLALQANPARIDAAHPAPHPWATGTEMRTRLRTALGRIPADQVLLVGDLDGERDWLAAGRLAGYLAADRYFGA